MFTMQDSEKKIKIKTKKAKLQECILWEKGSILIKWIR